MQGEYENQLRFSDNIVLVANIYEELQKQIDKLNIVKNEVGLKMNLAQTKIMYNELEVQDIGINNTILKIVEQN